MTTDGRAGVVLSVAVMAHPARRVWAEQLAARLGAPIVWDNGGGVWDTGRRALLAHDPGATHHLVVQDDAIVCRDLVAGLQAALVYAGPRPVGLYTATRPGRSRIGRAVQAATRQGKSWLQGHGLPLWGVASAHPVAAIPDLVAMGDAWQHRPNRYDLHTHRYYRHTGTATWYTCPSLVDHRPGPSLLGTPYERHAASFIGAGTSALSVDWSAPPHVVN